MSSIYCVTYKFCKLQPWQLELRGHALVVWRRIGSNKGGSQSLGSRLTGQNSRSSTARPTCWPRGHGRPRPSCTLAIPPVKHMLLDARFSNLKSPNDFPSRAAAIPTLWGRPCPPGWPPPPTMDRRGAFFIYCGDPEIFLPSKSRGDRRGAVQDDLAQNSAADGGLLGRAQGLRSAFTPNSVHIFQRDGPRAVFDQPEAMKSRPRESMSCSHKSLRILPPNLMARRRIQQRSFFAEQSDTSDGFKT